ncbi:unnamed protein product [Closterium sp. Yama58-4]|nr:unnamed protein product [Closterium sp. Yama58-4]
MSPAPRPSRCSCLSLRDLKPRLCPHVPPFSFSLRHPRFPDVPSSALSSFLYLAASTPHHPSPALTTAHCLSHFQSILAPLTLSRALALIPLRQSPLRARFFCAYAARQGAVVSLEGFASSTGVRKRRVYDIVNVLESIRVVQRQGKNEYVWLGASVLPQAIANLKAQALASLQGAHAPATLPPAAFPPAAFPPAAFPPSAFPPAAFPPAAFSPAAFPPAAYPPSSPAASAGAMLPPAAALCTPTRNGRACSPLPSHLKHEDSLPASPLSSPAGAGRSDKSLRSLTHRFVQLFLLHETRLLSWDHAVETLLQVSCDTHNLQTKARRLYDIANILAAICLVEKLPAAAPSNSPSARPTYRWLGTPGVAHCLHTIAQGGPLALGGGRALALGGGRALALGGGRALALGGGRALALGGGRALALEGGRALALGGGRALALEGGRARALEGGCLEAGGWVGLGGLG